MLEDSQPEAARLMQMRHVQPFTSCPGAACTLCACLHGVQDRPRAAHLIQTLMCRCPPAVAPRLARWRGVLLPVLGVPVGLLLVLVLVVQARLCRACRQVCSSGHVHAHFLMAVVEYT